MHEIMYRALYYRTKIKDNKQEDPASCREIFKFYQNQNLHRKQPIKASTPWFGISVPLFVVLSDIMRNRVVTEPEIR